MNTLRGRWSGTMSRAAKGLSISCVVGFAVCAAAQADGAAVPINIEAQPLASALSAWSKQTGFNTLVLDEHVKLDATSAPLSGNHTPREALSLLLKNTNLTYEFANEKTVTIRVLDPSLQQKAQAEPRMHNIAAREETTRPARKSKASAAEASDDEMEIVIVSAQRRETRLLETPISVGVLSGKNMDNSTSRGVSDAITQVGGVSLVETLPGDTRIAIRGVVPGIGTSTTGYYLDEVPFALITTSTLPDANAYDLARVEVLRGPQGTLYGVNSLSGVVRILTNDADLNNFESKGRARTSTTEGGGGNYGGDFAVNVPLIEGKLAIRGVASYSELSGFMDSSLTGERRINDTQAQAYRVKVNYQATDDLSVKFGVSRSDIDNGAPSSSGDDLTTVFSGNQGDRRVYNTYNLNAEYSFPRVSLLSSTSYIDYTYDNRPELLLSGTDRLNYANHVNLRSFSQEFRLASQLLGQWRWSAGGIYKDTKESQTQNAMPLFPAIYSVKEHSKSWATFGEVSRLFAGDKLELTLGARYFEDELLTTQQSDFFGGPVVVPRTADSDKVTGRVVLSYKPSDDHLVYGSVSTGFRSGLNQTPAVTIRDPTFSAVSPDSLINYEIGGKGELASGKVTYDTAVYYMKWKDAQQSLILPVGFVARVNAGEASGAGIDASLTYRPVPALSLNASVGWNDLKFDEDVLQTGLVLFAKDSRVNNSPEWTGSVGASYRLATSVDADVVFSTNFNYRSKVALRFLTAGLLEQSVSDPQRTLDASIGFERDRWTVEIYGDNLLNETDAITPPDITSALESVRQRPRTLGVQATFNY